MYVGVDKCVIVVILNAFRGKGFFSAIIDLSE